MKKAGQKEKKEYLIVPGFGGRERIRTAVRGFADLCLATRPRDLIYQTAAELVEWGNAAPTVIRTANVGTKLLLHKPSLKI